MCNPPAEAIHNASRTRKREHEAPEFNTTELWN